MPAATLHVSVRTHHVIVGIFDSSEGEDTQQGEGCGDGSQGGDLRDQLEDQQAEKVKICKMQSL